MLLFFFNDTATTEIYTLSLHDALPIWVGAVPYLQFIPDKDGDDKPDGPPEILLDGWNLKEVKHNIFSSFTWGPDGWLWATNGIQSKSKIGKPGSTDEKRVKFDCGVWRYHPTRHVFEVVAVGTTNPWGLDFDEYGQCFITNCVIAHLWHVIPGAHFERMYGQHFNPYHYGNIRTCAEDRKSTRLNSSHANISHAVFCLKNNPAICQRGSPPRAPLPRIGHPPPRRAPRQPTPHGAGLTRTLAISPRAVRAGLSRPGPGRR